MMYQYHCKETIEMDTYKTCTNCVMDTSDSAIVLMKKECATTVVLITQKFFQIGIQTIEV